MRGWWLPLTTFSIIPEFLPIVTEGHSDYIKETMLGLDLRSPTEHRKELQIL